MKRIKWSALLLTMGVVTATLMLPNKAVGLDEKYERNGECYMLIGEGGFKGIYRLNDPVSKIIITDPNQQQVVSKYNLGSMASKGFYVNLDRHIFTFSEQIGATFAEKPGNIWRQVQDDTGDASKVDYGTHAYHHTDDRPSGQRNRPIYGTSSGDRKITGQSYHENNPGSYCSNGASCNVRILRPENLSSSSTKPAGVNLPEFPGRPYNVRDYLTLREEPGKKWYSIPNGSWFSSWHRHQQQSSSGYMVYRDTEMYRNRNYKKYKWTNNGAGNNVSYPSTPINEGDVATAQDLYTRREYVCGCLDSCSNDGGDADTLIIEKEVDIVMQPSFDGGGERVYALVRDEDSANYTLKLNNVEIQNNYNSYFVRGRPEYQDSEWIGISLKDRNADYIYVLGNTVLNEWYTGGTVQFTAAAVSNLWDQSGGIVYAYEKTNNAVHIWEVTDTGASGVLPKPNSKYVGFINVKNAIDGVGGDGNKVDVFDLKADGFGNVYLGVTFPSTDISTFDPTQHLKPEFAVHMCVKNTDAETGYKKVNFIIPQEYSKAVFQGKRDSDEITKVGSKVFARTYYHTEAVISPTLYNQISSSSLPNNSWASLVRSAASTDSNISFNERIYPGKGCSCSGYTDMSGSDPGKCSLAVINVPTPPKVHHIGPTKESYLDIIGPYDVFCAPGRTTQQDQGLLNGQGSNGSPLQSGKLYFYMVENYPLYNEGITQQDPNDNPDWDNDGRPGGFVSTIADPHPYGNTDNRGKIRYEWKTWIVESGDDDPESTTNPKEKLKVFDLVNESTTNDGMPYTGFYSVNGGKYIVTCRVNYDWYDYDLLNFGDTISKKPNVLLQNKYAIPAKTYNIPFISENADGLGLKPSVRLNQIMNTPGFEFMKSQNEDYSRIYDYDDSDTSLGQFWAMEPIVVKGHEEIPTYPINIALIEKCDNFEPYVNGANTLEKYLNNSDNWSYAPIINSSTGARDYFGLESGKSYYWRINLASQTNLFTDISKVNGLDNTRFKEYNYVAHKIKVDEQLNQGTFADSTLVFDNNIGDTRWKDNIIYITMTLDVKKPDGSIDIIKLIDGSVSSDGMIKIGKKSIDMTSMPSSFNLDQVWNRFKDNTASTTPLFASSSVNIPPTDPMEATLKIKMARYYLYDIYKEYTLGSDVLRFKVPSIPDRIEIVGEAKIKTMDTSAPSFVWAETSPKNIYGVTGKPIDVTTMGPSGEIQDKIRFTVKDNNPWESQASVIGLSSLEDHVKNYVFNFGKNAFLTKFGGNPTLKSIFDNNSSIFTVSNGYYDNGIVGKIKEELRNNRNSSNFNLKPIFCKEARDVRIYFETATRDNTGKVTVRNASDVSDLNMNLNEDISEYSLHERARNDGSVSKIDFVDSEYFYGGTNSPSYSKIKYSMNTNELKIGYDNKIPDGYANNTPGYRPYKFYIRATDSSGNYSGEKVFNVALHVKDTIAPIAYATLWNDKAGLEEACRFPVKNDEVATSTAAPDVNNYIINQYYMSDRISLGLEPTVLDNTEWTADSSGYIKNSSGNAPVLAGSYYNYQARQYFNGPSDDIIASFSGFAGNLASSPKAVEDNVTCQFGVYVIDNCGIATGTLSVKFYDYDGNQQVREIESGFKQGSDVDETDSAIASNTNRLTVLFRGEEKQFPMAIPIIIEAEDNAMEWDYYPGGHEDSNGDWVWDPITPGVTRNPGNRRIFKTTLPVLGSKLNVRTIDRTIKNN